MGFKAMEIYWLLTKHCNELNVFAAIILTPQFYADQLLVEFSVQMAVFAPHEITPALYHQNLM